MGTRVPGLLSTFEDAMRRRDPGFDALRRAIRPAIVVPIGAAIALQLGGAQTPLFTIFGSFALLVLVDFPGTRGRRAVSYAVLAVVGYAFITVATFLAKPGWLGALSMLVVGVVVSFAAILSSSFSAAQRAALLLFVLPVASPAGPLADRLLGWTLALAFSVPAALFLLPPRHHDELRERARDVCAGLAARLEQRPHEAGPPERGAGIDDAMDRLRQTYLGSDTRPAGLTAGSRALIRVVDDLEWLTSQVSTGKTFLPEALRGPAVRVLQGSADVLAPAGRPDCEELRAAVDELSTLLRNRFGANIEAIVADDNEADAEALGVSLLDAHMVCSTANLIGRTVAWAAAADARPVIKKILGSQLPPTGAADLVLTEFAATRISVSPGLIKNSVMARNALRTGVGLAAAVALIQVVPVQHGFWVVLGAMSVLRSSALTTGSNVVRAVLGTAAGFVIGAGVVAVLGTNEVALWIALPVAAFGAAYIPKVISFAAGQAAFTVLVITLFNVLDPSGWRIGLVRVEDIAIGCAVAVVASWLLWPRGVATAAWAALDDAAAVHLRYLTAAAGRITSGPNARIEAVLTELRTESLLAYRSADDAARQYLSETGTAVDQRTPVVRAVNRAIRLRIIADSVADLDPTENPSSAGPRLCAVLDRHIALITHPLTWTAVSTAPERIAVEAVSALRADTRENAIATEQARPLIATAAYLGELELLQNAGTAQDPAGAGQPIN
ncbi:putative membrane protein YccC [Williamsia limnetica]|uniref:Putative membrane protein YccC n=1 Tax=Williamsia limnetica TaxID=882452 RepID=A0A318RN04_WILLI|nr:FUSC family protein [Williamsia limnetica]PYE17954.1 putative membrane protein YccC [Williamsia limnetica]